MANQAPPRIYDKNGKQDHSRHKKAKKKEVEPEDSKATKGLFGCSHFPKLHRRALLPNPGPKAESESYPAPPNK